LRRRSPAAAPVAITLSLVASIGVACRSALVATPAAMVADALAGRLAFAR
jgi:hypothetical protein